MRTCDLAVFGIFSHEAELADAVRALKAAGIAERDLSCLLEPQAPPAPLDGNMQVAATGAAVGGALGWLAGTLALTLAEVGSLLAAGPLVGALAGAGLGGAVATFTAVLIRLGLSEPDAHQVDGLVREGKVLLSVHCQDAGAMQRARELLHGAGARHVAQAREASDEVFELPPPSGAAPYLHGV